MRELRGKHAIITGCSRGIGMEVARLLATEGVHLVMNARDGDRLHKKESDAFHRRACVSA